MRRRLPWITAGLIVFVTFSIMYAGLQQVLRQGANDPQIQLAEDTAAALQQHQTPASLVTGHIDITRSLAPFVIIYDMKGNVVIGNGYDGQSVPRVPLGVLTHTNSQGYNAVTWELASGQRFAAVAVPAGHFRVLTARSLREIERRETQTETIVGVGWFLSLIILVISYFVCRRLDGGKPGHSLFSIRTITGILKSK